MTRRSAGSGGEALGWRVIDEEPGATADKPVGFD
jgi:hypothetical protein